MTFFGFIYNVDSTSGTVEIPEEFFLESLT